MAGDPYDVDLISVMALYIWGLSTLYKEFLALSLEVGFDLVRMQVWIIPKLYYIHAAPSNEKGMEDVFTRFRRLAKATENSYVSRDKLLFAQRTATVLTYPNVLQLEARPGR